MSVNKVILIGNLGNDPEIRQFDNGMLATASIATSERWTDKQTGERKEHTEWHRVVFNGRLAEIAQQYLRKGSQVYIEGSIHTRKWQDNQGIERYSTEIRANQMQMLGGQQQQQQGYQQPQGYQQAPQQGCQQPMQQQAPQSYQQQQPMQQQGQRYATHPNGAPVFPPQPLPNGQVMQPAQAVSNDDIPF